MPELARRDVGGWRRQLLPHKTGPVVTLPFEWILAALIDATESRRAEFEKRVSRGWSKRRRTHWRNELALNLKAIIMGCSPKMKHDERAAEKWVANVLDTVSIRYPDPDTNHKAFHAMFAVARVKPPLASN